jgi:hypothetical protein
VQTRSASWSPREIPLAAEMRRDRDDALKNEPRDLTIRTIGVLFGRQSHGGNVRVLAWTLPRAIPFRQALLRSLMEQSCYKCGQVVEEGVPFCPHCSAPQIRVVIAEPVSPALAFAAAAQSQDSTVLPASQTLPVLALPMQWSEAFRPCALAALVASLLMSMGLNPFVAMFSVGFLAVVFYRQRRRGISIKAPAGAALGALSGLLWFAMSSVLEALIVIFLHKGPDLRNELIVKIQQAASQTSDPQVQGVFERLKTQGGLEFLMLAGLLFAFLASIILGGLGGALGATILGRREKS